MAKDRMTGHDPALCFNAPAAQGFLRGARVVLIDDEWCLNTLGRGRTRTLEARSD